MERPLRYLLTITFFAAQIGVFGQQQATYAQYMFNGLAINPAYAGSHDVLSANFLGRFQNVGVPGAPTTQTFAIHSPIANQRFAVGFMVVNDHIGVINQTGTSGIYAYRLPIKKGGSISFGLQLGLNSYRANYTDLDIYQNDALFASNVRQNRLNVGAGVYIQKPLWYLGLSMPHMMNNVFDRAKDFKTVYQSVPIMFTGGYVFILNPMLKVKPNFLFKAVDGRPVELDLNANFLFDDVVWVGVSYKFVNAVVLLTETQITDQLRFGYSFSIATGPIKTAAIGSHELLLQYIFKFRKEGIVTPRYF
jgi:type IX secretion system PorP/SprF family membrane protein